MAAVAMDFAHMVSVNITAAGLFALGALYPDEQAACVAVVEQQMCIRMVFMSIRLMGKYNWFVCFLARKHFHILARGSDGLYYDPATGVRNNDWGNPTAEQFKPLSDYDGLLAYG